MSTSISYGSLYDQSISWGYWMTPIATPSGQVVWEDEDHTTWPSVRDCFWLMDLLCDALSGIGPYGDFKRPNALMDSPVNRISFWREYVVWMSSVGLINHGKNPLHDLKLTEEGHAVHLMLKATRIRPRVARWSPREVFQITTRNQNLAQAGR
jgi:hypothetical protein